MADKPPRTRFVPPSVEQVETYCRERGNNVDPDRFVNYYTARGWMLGRSAMRSWRAAVRTWERQEQGTEKAEPVSTPPKLCRTELVDGEEVDVFA